MGANGAYCRAQVPLVETCQPLFDRYENDEGEEILSRTVTGDTWVHHCEPESKRQSKECKHPEIATENKFKTHLQQER
jgi:hypothetical protein